MAHDKENDLSEGEEGMKTSSQGNSSADQSKASKFSDLNSARARRDMMVSQGKKGLIAISILVVLGGAAFVLFTTLNSSSQTNSDQVDSVTAPPAEVPEINCETAQIPAGSSDHPCLYKDEFQEKYRTFSTELLPELEGAGAADFVKVALADIQQLETNAIQAFDRSNFKIAVTSIDAAIKAGEQLKNDIAENFRSSFQEAFAAFKNNNFETANGAIERAVRLRPQDTEAALLKRRITVLPQVLALYRKVSEAEVQNQLLDQYNYMEQILSLDPEWQDIAAQITELGERIKEIRYSDLLKQAGELIDSDMLAQAKDVVSQANRIFAGRQDTVALSRQINEIEKKRRIATLLTEAKVAENNDNWPAALEKYQRVLGEEAANQQAENGLEKANLIINANNRAVDLLNQQNRMQDERIHQRIIEFAEQVKPLTSESRILSDTIRTLEETLALWRQNRTIKVFSDGKSIVKVRRVGNVGAHKTREIQLKPGNYEFECTRKGYRSNIVKHFIPPTGEVKSVTVVCDVPI
ncbi:hypothetical protein [Kordiimonas sp. SCSIO 12610]|uniref:hypothetical protein n=1 Tax=Kordiimonas sp. SCSIO 12610 TaxID=2829597 RepID=UPI00210DAB96|nr:hypothetical protein [Kordiimonas sp. SCSIO 12610]UTW55661.1 hypothetical protein KFF44_01860 [Kordiimonas sp. SCSIO 12610]